MEYWKYKGDPVLKEINRLKKNLRARPCPAKLPAWEKELKKSSSSEENRQLQKADANVTTKGASLAPSSSRAWQLQSPALGFRVKDTRKGLENLPPRLRLREAAEARHEMGYPYMEA